MIAMDTEEPVVRFAETDAEREAIFRLRYDVYIAEMNKPYAADHAHRRLTDDADLGARLMLATVRGEVAGTLRVELGADAPFSAELEATYGLERFRAGGASDHQLCVISRLIVRADHRSGPLVHRILDVFAESQAALGVEVIFLQCHPHLANFYGGLGFRPSGAVHNDPSAGVLVPMALITGDHEHLERVRSPLARHFPPGFGAGLGRSMVAALPDSPGVLLEGAQSEEFWADVSGLIDGAGHEKRGVLDGLPEEVVRALFSRSLVLDCKAGDYLIRKGQVLRTVFIVLSGELEVVEGDHVLHRAIPGEVLGEVAFLLGTKRTRDVRAASDGVRVLALSDRSLKMMIDADSRGAALLLLNLSRSLASKLAFGTGEPKK